MHRATCCLQAVLVVLLACLTSVTAAASPYTFINIDFPGAFQTSALGINDSGQVVGYYQDSSGVSHGFLLSAGTYTTIDCPSPYTASSVAYGINSSGQIVGRCAAPGGINGVYGTTRSFVLSGGVLTFLPDVPGSYNGASTFADAINDTGQIVGWYADGCLCTGHGFLLSAGTYTTIDVPGFANSYAYGINNSGQISGTTEAVFGGGSPHGFQLSGGVYTLIDDPDTGTNSGTQAEKLNNFGKIVGAYTSNNGAIQHGFLLDGGVFTTIDYPNALSNAAEGINSQGQVVGGYTDLTGVAHGYVTAPNAQLLKTTVLNQIKALLTSANKHDQAELRDASFYLSKALDPALWQGTDGNHLNPKRAVEEFLDEGLAAVELTEVLNDRHSSIPAQTTRLLLNEIVQADRTLATVAIADAAGRNAQVLAKANAQVALGDKAVSAGNFVQAIANYAFGWALAHSAT